MQQSTSHTSDTLLHCTNDFIETLRTVRRDVKAATGPGISTRILLVSDQQKFLRIYIFIILVFGPD